MRNYFFLMAAFTILIHFWRFPHLVMENGGGAFVILYLIILFTIALPVYIAEVAFAKVLGAPGSDTFALYRSRVLNHPGLRKLAGIHWAMQNLIFVGLFQFFLFMGCLAFLNFQDLSIGRAEMFSEPALAPPDFIGRIVLIAGFCALIALMTVRSWPRKLVNASQWLVPFSVLVFGVVLVQILSVGSHIEGIKTLLYPDFSKLRGLSLLEALGHALISVCAGVGFQRLAPSLARKYDPVEISAQVAGLSSLIALFSGLLVLPMVEQVSESAFGANWLFFILPRWLLYNKFGLYYCHLFFLALIFLATYLGVQTTKVFSLQYKKENKPEYTLAFIACNGVLGIVLLALFYQKNWWGWWGQNIMVLIDRYFIDILFPLNGMVLVGLLFTLSNRHQREEVFTRQQIFFHSVYFYRIWRLSCRVLFPLTFLAAVVLKLLV